MRAGKARYLGFSNLPAWLAMKANAYAAAHGLDNLASTEVKLSPEQLKALDEASALPPEYPGWMLDFQNREVRGAAST